MIHNNLPLNSFSSFNEKFFHPKLCIEAQKIMPRLVEAMSAFTFSNILTKANINGPASNLSGSNAPYEIYR